MATVIDITSKLKQEEKFVKIGNASYKVDASKNAMIEVMATLDGNSTLNGMDAALTRMLGKQAMKEIDKMNLDFGDFKTVFVAVFAAASDITMEEAEARFQSE